MRRISKKRQQRIEETRVFRNSLIQQSGECMLCGNSPRNPRHRVHALNQLCCHEILNGPLRDRTLDERSCLIVACWYCNQYELDNKGDWPLARQLAIIKHKAPERYDLQRVLEIRNPRAMKFVTEDEVDGWIERDWE